MIRAKHAASVEMHRGKLFWPKEGYTKGDLLDYYERIAPTLLPYLKDRPQNLNRFPNGIEGKNFFQKDVANLLPSWVDRVKVYSATDRRNLTYAVTDDVASLLYLVNLGCIEINPWNSRRQRIRNPDYAVIDLDPEGIGFVEVVRAARATHEVLEDLAVPNFCKTSGKTGLHIFIPTGGRYTFDQVRQFAKSIAMRVQARLPATTSVARDPKKRKDRIYLDFLQNRLGQTLAAPYSVRPWRGATVSAPLDWKEVKAGLDPSRFTIKTIFRRLRQKGDLWTGVLGRGIDLPRLLRRLQKSQ